MKKISLILLAAAWGGNAYALGLTKCFINESSTNCLTCGTVKRQILCPNQTYCDCATCPNGETPILQTVTISTSESYTYGECKISIKPVSCPTECPDTTWSDVTGQNYQARCDGNLISPACEYQCKIGYYGTGTSCTRCPSSGGVYGTTSGAGATKITECFLPAGTAFSDTTGSGTYTENCYYSN